LTIDDKSQQEMAQSLVCGGGVMLAPPNHTRHLNCAQIARSGGSREHWRSLDLVLAKAGADPGESEMVQRPVPQAPPLC